MAARGSSDVGCSGCRVPALLGDTERTILLIPRSPAALATSAWTVAILLGLVHAAAHPFYVNPDGLSYLDLATLYSSGDWQGAVNAYWSPLFPMVIAAVLAVVKPSAYWEAPLVHAIGFFAYILAFAAFRLFLRAIRDHQAAQSLHDGELRILDFRKPVETAVAYALFHLCALAWVGLENITPDMLVAAAAFAAAAVALRAHLRRRLALFGLAGAIAGVGYLTKAIMFPVGFVFCFACAIPSRRPQYLTRTAVALVSFLLVCSPQIIALSRQAGSPTYGAVGNLAYSWLVNKTPLRWTGRPAGTGAPVNPIKRIDASLPAFEYAYPQPAFAFPFWDIPAHWREGIKSYFDLDQQIEASKAVLAKYATIFGFLAVAIVLLLTLRSGALSRVYVPVILPGMAALALYALVHAEPRLIGPWPILAFMGVAASARFSPKSLTHARRVLAATALVGVAITGVATIESLGKIVGDKSSAEKRHINYEIAQALRTRGVKPGSKVAAIEASWECYWARLAGVQVAMEVVKRAAWRATTDSARTQMLSTFRAHGAAAVVELRDSSEAPLPGWENIGSSRYSFLLLDSAAVND